ncbi:MAG: pentapeptide repeat-containing protein, partial [Rhizobiales bacterium]|nr:pentapeptide repeat-containing protein [Rhizobacter sp.]
MTDTQPQHLSLPGTPSWLDFEPLLPAERMLLRAAARGDIAKVGYRRPRSATADVRLRAEFLAVLARGVGEEGAPVSLRRLQVMGACIVGRLDLAGATVPMSLWFYRCTFGAAPLFEAARVRGSVAFSDCALPGLRAEGCVIEGELAITAGCSVDGEIQLARSVVRGDLDCERLRMRSASPAERVLRQMFVADGMQVAGSVNLHGGVESVGEMRFVGAQIGSDLRASTARMTADVDAAGTRGVALNLDRARIGGSV